MNGTETRADEVAQYLAEVGAALRDLPAQAREELLEDLPDHLAEVASEDPGTLVARLGSPASYAAELCAAAGLRTGPTDGGGPGWAVRLAPAIALLGRLTAWCREADLRLGKLIGYPRLRDFVRLLRPGWWVLRGYAVDVFLIHLVSRPVTGVIPSAGGSFLVGFLLLLACVVASIWLGSRSGSFQRLRSRSVLIAANVVFALMTYALAVQLNDDVNSGPDAYQVQEYEYVTDVIPVGPDGRTLSGVTLYDQNGNELQLGQPWNCAVQADGSQAYHYPLCVNPGYSIMQQTHDGLSATAPSPSIAPSASTAPTVSTAPTASTAPGVSTAPTASTAPGVSTAPTVRTTQGVSPAPTPSSR